MTQGFEHEVGISTAIGPLPDEDLAGGLPTRGTYLLIFEGESARLFHLPAMGTVVIGRIREADVRLEATRISRIHARLLVKAGQVTIEDAGSQNGTTVNGERLSAPRLLHSGDTLGMGGVTIVFHGEARASPSRLFLPQAAWRDRLEEELERAARYGRDFAVLVLRTGTPLAPDELGRIARRLRRMDVLGLGGPDELLVLLPETSANAPQVAQQLKHLLAGRLELRVGLARYPGDGCDADALVGGARQAARSAPVGGTATVAESSVQREVGGRPLIVADAAMVRLFDLIERLAPAELPVLILGETGTGKELASSALHHWGPRAAAGALVAVNCAAIPEGLVESELFGHEKGAFSGAIAARAGLLEAADGGTLFLDEIGELSASAQAKLLRVLDEQRFTRVGSTRERSVRVRVVAATHRNLEAEVRAGRFRQDLYFRLGAARLWLPPLRDRPVELLLLAQRFLAEACGRLTRPPLRLTPGALEQLSQHHWPGNVRELRHAMDFLAASVAGDRVDVADLDPVLAGSELSAAQAPAPESPVETDFRPIEDEVRDLEHARMQQALAASGGNKTQAAALIRMPLRTFLTKLKRYVG